MESDIRYYRRRASEELKAAERAVTAAARERRMQLASQFLERLQLLEMAGPASFDWSAASLDSRVQEHA